jgi:signal transduction histidine kinase
LDFLYGTWEMLDIILKLLLAALCGGLVGIQRSNKMSQVNMPAGVIACLSASLFIIIIVRLDYILHIGIENIGIDSDKQKTQFYRFTSHELKSPIIAIKTAIDSVKKNCLDQLDERPLNLLERASLRCDQMLEIIKELLELSKNRSLSDNIKSEEIKIQELLNMVIQAEIIKAEERKIKVITNFDSRDPVVLGQSIPKIENLKLLKMLRIIQL